ncbi:MAG: hypothetical protein ACXVJE_19360 [Mucilaginibacter sp.]
MNWILNNKRLFFELVLLLIIVVLALFIRYRLNQVHAVKVAEAAKTTLHNPTAPPISIKKDSEGLTHFEVSENTGEIPQDALKDTAVTNGTFADTTAKALKIKTAQLLELTKIKLALQAENIQLKAAKDSLGNLIYSYRDKWLQLDYDPKNNQAALAYNVNILTGKFTPASWLPFTSKPPLLDFSTDDTRAVINHVEHFTAIIPQPFVGFTADFKAMYLIDTRQIFPSIGANLRLGRWHLEGRAYYDQKVRQAVGLSYDLLKF